MADKDKWIIGEGDVSNTEYIVHLETPRFIAKFIETDDDRDLPLSNYSIEIEDCLFYDIVWIGKKPRDSDMVDIFKRANNAIDRYSFKED